MSNKGGACVDLLRKQRAEAEPDIEHYIHEGALMNLGAFAVHYPCENYSVGGHMETVFQYGPLDEVSLAGVGKLLAETIDPSGRFGRYGIPILTGGLQLGSISQLVEDWSSRYDDYGKWLQKIKAMLDPDNLSEWTAYVPTTFAAEDRE